MKMLVQSVVLPCLPVFNAALPVRSVSAASAAICEYLGVLFSYRRWRRVADYLHDFKPKPESGFREDLLPGS